MSNSFERARVIFHGRVQGVGFRYTVCQISRNYELITGQVRNLADGTVEMIAEGTREQILEFISDINSRMSSNISEQKASWSSGSRHFNSFGVGH